MKVLGKLKCRSEKSCGREHHRKVEEGGGEEAPYGSVPRRPISYSAGSHAPIEGGPCISSKGGSCYGWRWSDGCFTAIASCRCLSSCTSFDSVTDFSSSSLGTVSSGGKASKSSNMSGLLMMTRSTSRWGQRWSHPSPSSAIRDWLRGSLIWSSCPGIRSGGLDL